MSPKWIHSNAIITEPHALYPQYFAILSTTGARFKQALQVQLVAPNVLTYNDSVTITVTVAVDTILADNGDHDPIFGISDGVSFIGFITLDKNNYPSTTPCYKIEGKVATASLQNVQQGTGARVASRKYSSEIKMQIKPTEKWGSCHTAHDEGYVNIQEYQVSLNLTKTLYFEVYKEDAAERYHIKYIVVDVDFD